MLDFATLVPIHVKRIAIIANDKRLMIFTFLKSIRRISRPLDWIQPYQITTAIDYT